MHALAAAFALLLERLFGYPAPVLKAIGHPVIWVGKLIDVLDIRLNRADLPGRERKRRGVAALALLLLAVLVPTAALALFLRQVPGGWVIEALLATTLLAQKELGRAVRSVADALEPHCSSMIVPETPFVLHLPNVMHLASDVAGVVHDAGTVSSLQLAASLHPSAAVGGTPTVDAVALISEIEGMARGRYAGPVGWMDTTGDGEWGIALRSAEIAGNTVRLFAGCGIVADSDPEAELAESQAKLVPVRDSLAVG